MKAVASDYVESFVRASRTGLRNTRVRKTIVVWEDERWCNPPLAEVRAFVLEGYFDDTGVDDVKKDESWKETDHSPHLFQRCRR